MHLLSDSWALRDLAEKLRKEGQTEPKAEIMPTFTGYIAVVVKALDNSLQMIGRTGSQVIHQIFYERYGLKREDVALKTGTYMSALKDMLGSSAPVLERYMLREIEEETRITAPTIEEAVHLLKAHFG